MKKGTIKILLLLTLLLPSSSVFGQKHDANWILGEYRSFQDTMNFGCMVYALEDEVPEVINLIQNEIPYHLANSSYSSNEEELIVFTNGCKFYNAQGNVISGGENLHNSSECEDSGFSLTQSIFFLPDPSSSNSFYSILGDKLFFLTNGDLQLGHDSIVFFKLEYEKQDSFDIVITSSREIIAVDTFSDERMSSTRHANGRDWWLILNHHKTNIYSRYLLGANGFSYEGEQEIGEPTKLGIDQAHYSPDGEYYAAYSLNGQTNGFSESTIEFMEFDRCTGLFSNFQKHALTTDGNGLYGGVSFSPNSRFMYVSRWNEIYQFDMEAADIIGSKVVVAEYDGFTAPNWNNTAQNPTRFFLMQTAPNGKIYISVVNNYSRYLHVIDQPDEQGLSCNVLQHEIEMPFFNWLAMPHYPNYRLGPLIGSFCDTLRPIASFNTTDSVLSAEFFDLSTGNPEEWFWTFGDGTNSEEQDPAHTYSSTGTYEVCLIATNAIGSDTSCQEITLINTGLSTVDNIQYEVYPNPTSDILNITVPDSKTYHWTLINALGQSSRRGRLDAKETAIDVQGMESGVYYLELKGLRRSKILIID